MAGMSAATPNRERLWLMPPACPAHRARPAAIEDSGRPAQDHGCANGAGLPTLMPCHGHTVGCRQAHRQCASFAPGGSLTMLPRPYQTKAIADLRQAMTQHKRVLLVLPTGAGKTFIAATVARGAYAKGRRVVFLVHRQELVEQTHRTFTAEGIPHAVLVAGQGHADQITVASVQTLARRLVHLPAPPPPICCSSTRPTMPWREHGGPSSMPGQRRGPSA